LFLEDLVHVLRRQLLAEPGVDLVVPREQCFDVGNPFLDVAAHVFRGVQARLLRQEPDGDPFRGPGLAEEVTIFAGHDAEQRALPRSVQSEHPDLRAGKKRQPDVFEDDVVGRMDLPESLHGVDELHGV
jgi:hypothetical protein